MKIQKLLLAGLFIAGTAHAGLNNPSYNGSPYFSAYQSAAQAVTAATWTKIQFNTKNFDSNGYYDNVTNYRFTPLIAGKYKVTVQVAVNSTLASASSYIVAIYKNGAAIDNSYLTSGLAANQSQTLVVTATVQLNGTTDYIEGWVNIPGTSPTTSGGQTLGWIEATYIGP